MKKIKIFLFYFLEFTQGLPLTFIGLIVSLILIVLGNKPKKFGPSFCFPMTSNWGLELWFGSIVNKSESYQMKCHELGHAIQNSIFGIFSLFLTYIPSSLRFWLYRFKDNEKRCKYIDILCGVVSILLFITLSLGFAHNILFLIILSICFLLYLGVLYIWARGFEIPKFQISRPLYDDAWFEGTATKWGIKFMKECYPKDN